MAVYRVGELFCGAGGLALGAKRALVTDHQGEEYRLTHTWAADIDQWACETFRNNIIKNEHEAEVLCTDIRKLNIPQLRSMDGLLFGFPCNDFSQVGEQRGINGEYGALYQYGVEVLNVHEPLFFLAENVSGLSSADEGQTFNRILTELSRAGRGYNTTAHLYKFEEYGVPQCRHRIIIIGFRQDLNIRFRVPAPTHAGRYVSCAEALRGVENVPHNNERTRHSRTTVERLTYIPQGGNAWHPNVPEHLRLNVKGCQMSQIYRRLSADQPAYTITGSGGGGTHVYHWAEPRALTNRERARLQSFDDDFIFYGPKEAVRAQIGHAVPPKGAQVILEAVLKCLAGIDYASVPASILEERTDHQEENLHRRAV